MSGRRRLDEFDLESAVWTVPAVHSDASSGAAVAHCGDNSVTADTSYVERCLGIGVYPLRRRDTGAARGRTGSGTTP